MSKPIVIFDSTIDIPKIQMMYFSEDSVSNDTVDQTKVEGILTPIISVNGRNVPFNQVSYFKLSSIDIYPTLELCVNDASGILKILNAPGENNMIQVQILPAFDDTYKKINLLFYITSYEAVGSFIEFTCIYSIPKLFDDKLESFGNIDTYQLCSKIASSLQLGFVSNVVGSSDSRWIYCNNVSYIQKLKSEMNYSGNSTQIFDMWIDFRNNISLVDIYERLCMEDYNLQVWVADSTAPNMESSESKPRLSQALITNAVIYRGTPLFTSEYTTISNNLNTLYSGNDSIVMSHSFNSFVSDDTYLVNSSKSDTDVTKIVYGGEYFGDFNYISQRGLNTRYKNKVKSNLIQLSLDVPCLGLLRGDKVNVAWYEYNTFISKAVDGEDANGDDPIINENVSGQYYINGCIIEYNLHQSITGWKQTLILSKVNTKNNE